MFDLVSDTFGLPKGAPDRDNAIAWLKLLGSVEGQDAFNPLKGSTPARLDADMTLYNAYYQSAAADLKRDAIVGSLFHGSAASPEFVAGFGAIIEAFMSDHNVDSAAIAAQQLADRTGIRG